MMIASLVVALITMSWLALFGFGLSLIFDYYGPIYKKLIGIGCITLSLAIVIFLALWSTNYDKLNNNNPAPAITVLENK